MMFENTRLVTILAGMCFVLLPVAQAAPVNTVLDGDRLGTLVEWPVRGVVEVETSDTVDGGPQAILDVVLRYVQDFDPNDDLPTQVRRAHTLATDLFAQTQATIECAVFVADPDFLDRIAVDLSGAPERLRVELPFAMVAESGYSTGYLLIVVRTTGELECGLDNDWQPLA